MRWVFLTALVLVAGGVAAFAIWTFGKEPADPESVPAPPGWWRPEFAERRLLHTPWAIKRQANEADCLGLGDEHVTGTIFRYRRFDCTAEIWTGDDYETTLVELRIGPGEEPIVVPRAPG